MVFNMNDLNLVNEYTQPTAAEATKFAQM